MTIHIRVQGQGVPLVLFHGWGFDGDIWQWILPCLTERFEVHCVDLPGFGRSAMMSWEAFKNALLAQLPADVILMGWSLGGMVATRLALEASHRVIRLVNVASSPYFIRETGWPGIAEPMLLRFYEQLQVTPQVVMHEFMTLQLPPAGEEAHAQVHGLTATPSGLEQGLDWLRCWDFRLELERLTMPVMYVFGRLDAIVPQRVMRVMQSRYPQFKYVMLDKAAHGVFISHPNAFLEAVFPVEGLA